MEACLKSYYGNRPFRYFINFAYLVNLFFLCVYLMFIPIQIAYFWLLSSQQNGAIQTNIDITVFLLYLCHLLLYLDEKFEKIRKNPYASIYRQILTIQLLYDLFTLFLAMYMIIVVKNTIAERIVQGIFILKIYKLFKFDLKCTYFVIGTMFYPAYKLIRTLLVVFMVIAYFGSIFYGISYYELQSGYVHRDLIWIVSTPAIQNCYEYPFIVQLEYAMYWALGTASTAAYGDISGASPLCVLWNVITLAFEGFIFGFYLNSMHSIPMESKKKEADLLQKFDSFQQHSSNRKLDKKLYLQILCSLEYNQTQKRSIDSLNKVMPKKYMQEIKFQMYSKFIGNEMFFGNSSLQLAIAEDVKETVCELNEDVYKYHDVNVDDLLFLKEGHINYILKGQLQYISQQSIRKNQFFGVYNFLTGLYLPQQAICMNYSVVYSLSRSDYKKHLNLKEKIIFQTKMVKAFHLQGYMLVSDPVLYYYQALEINNSYLTLISPDFVSCKKRADFIESRNKQMEGQRKHYGRGFLKSKKIIERRTKRDFWVQTDSNIGQIEDQVLIGYQDL